jgi:cytochrome P450
VLGSQSMVITEGSAWKKQRDTFNPGFSSTFLRAALPGFVSCTSHMVQELERAAADKRVLSMHELSILTTTEVICKVWEGCVMGSWGLESLHSLLGSC